MNFYKMEFEYTDIANLKNISWGSCKHWKYTPKLLTCLVNKEVVGYSIIGYNDGNTGIVLGDGEFSFNKINHVVEWIEIRSSHRGKGYGSSLISRIRDEYMSKKIPICLEAYNGTLSFYFKLGAILSSVENAGCYMAFLFVDQVEEYMPDEWEKTLKFNKNRSLRKICKNVHYPDDGGYICDRLMEDTEEYCSACAYYETLVPKNV